MGRLSRQTIFLLLLLLLAFLSWWVLTITDPNARRRITISQEGPDHFMENFVITTLSKAGTPTRKLQAQRLTHYPNQEHADVVEPQLTFYKNDNSTWVASARTGVVKDNNQEIILTDDVHIRRPGDVANEININTQDLRIFPDDDYAQTAGSVVIQQNENTVTAMGMEAHFGLGEIELLSDVRGWYVR